MALHSINRGYIPNLRGDTVENPVKGFLRVGPETKKVWDFPWRYSSYSRDFNWLEVEVDYSAINKDPANRARYSYKGGERPLEFSGRIALLGSVVDVTGIHYRSGNIEGSIEIPRVLELTTPLDVVL